MKVVQNGDGISAHCHWLRSALFIVGDHLQTQQTINAKKMLTVLILPVLKS